MAGLMAEEGEGFSLASSTARRGNEVDADQDQEFMPPDPIKRFMNRPNTTPEDFNRGVNLDG